MKEKSQIYILQHVYNQREDQNSICTCVQKDKDLGTSEKGRLKLQVEIILPLRPYKNVGIK